MTVALRYQKATMIKKGHFFLSNFSIKLWYNFLIVPHVYWAIYIFTELYSSPNVYMCVWMHSAAIWKIQTSDLRWISIIYISFRLNTIFWSINNFLCLRFPFYLLMSSLVITLLSLFPFLNLFFPFILLV